LMIAFCALVAASLFWSSIDPQNVDKTLRFLLLTSTSFFVARMLAQERKRRERLLRLLAWLSSAILLYYAYYRYILGIDISSAGPGERTPENANNYLEYNAHAGILFIIVLSAAVFGSRKQLGLAVIGCGAALFALVTVGGRGPLALSLLAIPLTALDLALQPRWGLRRMTRLIVLVSAVSSVALVGYMAVEQLQGPTAVREQLHTLERFEMQLSREHTDSMDERWEGQGFAFRQWQEKPVLGWGIGEFRVQNNYLKYPHNLFLEILMEMGLVGAFLFFSVCAVAVIECARTAREGRSGWADAAITLLFLTELTSHVTVQGYLADDRHFLAYMGMAIGLRGGTEDRRPYSRRWASP
jgi:O-antigen ligase